MSGSRTTQDQFDEDFQRLEREEKKSRMLEQAVAMRPMRMRTLEAITGGIPRGELTIIAAGDKRGRTTF